MTMRSNFKQFAKYYGPLNIQQMIEVEAYKLDFHSGSQIHPMLHVSLLMKMIGDNVTVKPAIGEYGRRKEFSNTTSCS